MKTHRTGFTLIELLVVISIMALLASLVLSSLNTARNKGYDNTIKANLKQIALQTENFRDLNYTLGADAVCTTGTETGVFNDPKIKEQITNLRTNLLPPGTITCSTDSEGSKWAVSVANLRYAGTTWCIDNSQGWFKPGTSAAGICS